MLHNTEYSRRHPADINLVQLISAYYRVLIKGETFPPEFTEKLLLKASETPGEPFKDAQLREADLAIDTAVRDIIYLLKNPDEISRRWFEKSQDNQTRMEIFPHYIDIEPTSDHELHPVSLLKVITSLVAKRLQATDSGRKIPSFREFQYVKPDDEDNYSAAGMGTVLEKYLLQFSPQVAFKIERVQQEITRFMNEPYRNQRLVLSLELYDFDGQLEQTRQATLRDRALTSLDAERLRLAAENNRLVDSEISITHYSQVISHDSEVQRIIDTLIKDQGYYQVENNPETQQITLANADFEVFFRKIEDRWHISAKAQEYTQNNITSAETERALSCAREILHELLERTTVKQPLALSSLQANNFAILRIVRDRAKSFRTREHLVLNQVKTLFQAWQPAEIETWVAEKSAQLAQDGEIPQGITVRQGEHIWQVNLSFADNGQPEYDVQVWKVQ